MRRLGAPTNRRYDCDTHGHHVIQYEAVTAVAKRIEQDIRQLPLEDLLLLHEHLVDSIHDKEAALDPGYRLEIQRRMAEIDSGKVEGVDAFQALKEM